MCKSALDLFQHHHTARKLMASWKTTEYRHFSAFNLALMRSTHEYSLGNHIPHNTNAEDMYVKVMSIPIKHAVIPPARMVTLVCKF
jgi:hypothetical protein